MFQEVKVQQLFQYFLVESGDYSGCTMLQWGEKKFYWKPTSQKTLHQTENLQRTLSLSRRMIESEMLPSCSSMSVVWVFHYLTSDWIILTWVESRDSNASTILGKNGFNPRFIKVNLKSLLQIIARSFFRSVIVEPRTLCDADDRFLNLAAFSQHHLLTLVIFLHLALPLVNPEKTGKGPDLFMSGNLA